MVNRPPPYINPTPSDNVYRVAFFFGKTASYRQQEKMRQTLTADNSFKAVALQWHKKQKPHWSDSHATRTLAWLERTTALTWGQLLKYRTTLLHKYKLLANAWRRGRMPFTKKPCARTRQAF